jgi:hypothetical protein
MRSYGVSTGCSSPAVIGSVGFSRGGRFSFPRSYLKGVILATNTFTWTQFDNLFISNTVTPPPTNIQLLINPTFFAWSSNTYTLDYVVCEHYYYRTSTGEKIAAPLNIFWVTDPVSGSNYLKFVDPDGIEGSSAVFDLPPPPPGYWVSP